MEIISKRNPYKFYLNLILINGSFLILISIFQEYFKYNINSFIIGSLILLALATVITMGFIKNAPRIILDKKGIRIKNDFYWWYDLSSAKLTGKGGMIFTSGECATLTFNDFTEIKIIDDFYSNIAEIKCFIQQIVIEKKDKIEEFNNKIDSFELTAEDTTTYNGNPIFTLTGILMWGNIMLFSVVPIINSVGNIISKAYAFLLFLSVLLFLLFSRMYHYFEISQKYLQVKKYYFFWKKEVYEINHIKEIVFYRYSRHSNGVRIITKDFKTKSFLVANLRDKRLLMMKKDLEGKKIKVRNECISEN
jgi:hypothetical protein